MATEQREPLLDINGEPIETVKLTPEQEAARKRRSLMTALALVAFIVLIFLVTVLRLTSNYNSGA